MPDISDYVMASKLVPNYNAMSGNGTQPQYFIPQTFMIQIILSVLVILCNLIFGLLAFTLAGIHALSLIVQIFNRIIL